MKKKVLRERRKATVEVKPEVMQKNSTKNKSKKKKGE